MNHTKTLLATLILVATAMAPLGSSEIQEPNPVLAEATPTYNSALQQELLTLLGWQGNLGIDDKLLDTLALQYQEHAGTATEILADAKASLHRLQTAQGLGQSIAAATHATGNEVTPEAPTPKNLAPAITEMYTLIGAQPTLQDILELQSRANELDASIAAGLAQIVTAMNHGIQAQQTGDPGQMLEAAGNILAAIEVALPSFQLAAGHACGTMNEFEDPLFFIVVSDTCDNLHEVDRYLSIDLGGDDTYTNNAGGADVTDPFAYANPAVNNGGVGSTPGVLVATLNTRDTTEINALVADLRNTDDPNYVYNRYSDDYYGRLQTIRDQNSGVVSFPAVLGQTIANCLASCGVNPNFDPVALHDHGPIGIALDLGGDDTYSTSKEASQGGARNGIGILVDLGGTDNYSAPNLAQGAAERGVGILIDVNGNDNYTAGRDAQGSFDGGYLLDLDGDDTYIGGPGTQGARRVPFGGATTPSLLFDAHGADTYTATGYAQGAGNILIDAEGDDVYTATGPDPADTFSGVAQGVGFLNANGLLLDGDGDDKYSNTGEGGQAYGLDGYGAGVLIDLEGDDEYWASHAGQSACSVDVPFGSFLYDGGGNDSYTAGTWGQGSSRAPCTALLVDRDGNDSYQSGDNGQGATELHSSESTFGITGVGILADGNGNDTYSAGAYSQGSSEGPGLGLLLDADGVDSYSAGDYSQGAGGQGVGILIDGLQEATRTSSEFSIESREISFDVSGGLPGDTGGGDTYSAGDYSQGSSGPLGLIGILIDNDDEGGEANSYDAGLYSQGSAVAAGIGVFVDRQGTDHYSVTDESKSRGFGQVGADFVSVGLFADLEGGDDEYSGFGPAPDGNDRCEGKGSGLEIDTEGIPSIACLTGLSTAAEGLVNAIISGGSGGGPGAGPGALCPAVTGTVWFCDDVEGAVQFTAFNGLNEWRIVNHTAQPQPPGQANAYSGTHYWYVGTPGSPGNGYLGGDGYIPMVTTLTSDPFTIGASGGAPVLEFRLAGQVELDTTGQDQWDKLIVTVTDGTTTKTVTYDGTQAYTPAKTITLPAGLIGATGVTIIFEFYADEIVEDGPGFNLDDIMVSG